ncbi:GNAT family N-acetyltransferase [Oceanomicrobium pacificus]|uniref:GNAT family N-acetyltransferase n=1 Tax=Oceanomicrobium pacificus TaxID=2692916 RepID=A0A6B0TJH3_9RHOB|nr:GNAT family N-acetyltransferase [Oceanomicrobium pacificus]MXU64577.1 GNAT family N-acetyltransferase [Oceanomicrobium pacificus]
MAPTPQELYRAVDRTWAPADVITEGPWTIRRGEGGGKRVSAATLNRRDIDDLSRAIEQAEEAMSGIGQEPLFMIRDGDALLDARLGAIGYRIVDPVTLFVASADRLSRMDHPDHSVIRCDAPLAIQRDIWAAGGVGPERIAAMERVTAPKTFLLARCDNQPAACAFIAADGDVTMLHAMEVAPRFRRRGLGRLVTAAAAEWAMEQGSGWLSLLATRANTAANGLYRAMGMEAAAQYHYRQRQTQPPRDR